MEGAGSRSDQDLNADHEVLERLDRLITLMGIGFADAIERVRTEVQEDPVAGAILAAAAEDWVASGELQGLVVAKAKVSERTVQRSLHTLSQRGLLLTKGSGRLTSYRSSGIV
jgi:2-methylaconitate cis-trans-isomerase PrpF